MLDLDFIRSDGASYGVTCYTMTDLDRELWLAELFGYTLSKMEVV